MSDGGLQGTITLAGTLAGGAQASGVLAGAIRLTGTVEGYPVSALDRAASDALAAAVAAVGASNASRMEAVLEKSSHTYGRWNVQPPILDVATGEVSTMVRVDAARFKIANDLLAPSGTPVVRLVSLRNPQDTEWRRVPETEIRTLPELGLTLAQLSTAGPAG